MITSRLFAALPLLALCFPLGCGGPPREQAPQPAPQPSAELSYEQIVQAAQSYLESGKLDRAREVAAQAAAQDPTQAQAYIIGARAAFLSRDTPAALELYQKAYQTGLRERRFLMELAGAYDLGGQPQKALEIYRELLAQHPNDAEVHQELGLTAIRAGEVPAGIESLRKAIELAPKNQQARIDLGYALLLTGELAGAAEVLEQVPPDYAGHYKALQFLAQIRAGQGDPQEALELLTKAIASSGKDPEPTRLRARMRTLTGDAEGALADYDRLLQANPQDAGALIGAIGALVQLERLPQAKERVDQARALIGDEPPVQFRAAQVAWREGDAQAVDVITAYAESHPMSLEAWREVAAAAQRFNNEALAKRAQARLQELEK